MKRILFLSLLLSGCATHKISKDSEEAIFIDEYKLKYFKSCLKVGLDYSPEVTAFLKLDKSGYGEPVLGLLYSSMDSLAKSRLEKVRAAKAKLPKREKAEGADGNKTISYCLCEFESKWLDSIARREAKGPGKRR